MKKKLRLAALPFLLSLLGYAFPANLEAQVTYTTPQTVKAVIASGVACTGSPQTFKTSQGIPNFRNLGQTQHYVSAQVTGAAQTFNVEIDGIDKNGNVFRLSDVLALPGSNTNGAVTGSGSFDNFQVMVTCTTGSASFTLTYSGTSATSNIDAGAYLFAQTDKVLFSGATANANHLATLQTPFSTSAGTISLIFNTVAATNGTLTVLCLNSQGVANLPSALTVTLPAVTSQQNFNVPAQACTQVTVSFASSTGGGGTVNIEYLFNLPGALNNFPNQYTHITGTTATTVAASQGFLHSLAVNTGAAGTISVFDIVASACTGTPTTPLIAKITLTGNTPQTFTYDVLAANGICVQASATMDITVSAHAP